MVFPTASRLNVVLAMAAVSSVAATALAAALRYRAHTQNWTAAAGSEGENHVDITTTADFYGLQVMTLWDYDQRVCAIQLEQSGFNTKSISVQERVKLCEPRVKETWKRADVGSGRFITAVAACVGGSEGVIRGLEVKGSTLHPNGIPKNSTQTARFAFEDCAWSELRYCPWPQVATGVRVYLDEVEKGAVGIALRCHRLEPR
jgi:hypothetical protein